MNETYGDIDWELSELLNCLRIEIEAREKCAPGRKDVKRANIGYPTAAALTIGTSKANCTFCKGAHTTSECHIVTDIRERRNILKREGQNYICSRSGGHVAHECRSSINCFTCKGRHRVIERGMVKLLITKAEMMEIDHQASQASPTNSAEPAISLIVA